jgi:hypothetical protein
METCDLFLCLLFIVRVLLMGALKALLMNAYRQTTLNQRLLVYTIHIVVFVPLEKIQQK